MWLLGYISCWFCSAIDTATANKFSAIVSITRTKKTGYLLGIPRIFLGKLFPGFLGFPGIKKPGFGAKFLGKLGTFFGENGKLKPGKLGKLGNVANFLGMPGNWANCETEQISLERLVKSMA